MKDLCPICSGILLRHLHQKELTWFCSRCRQEMPNFDSQYSIEKSKKSLCQKIKIKHSKNITILRYPAHHNAQLSSKSLSWLELFVEEYKIRLEVVSFIIIKTKSIINNSLVAYTKLSFESLGHDRKRSRQSSSFNCLRDTEIILLYICFAILLQNSNLLKHQYFKDLKVTSTTLNLPVDQKVQVINLMKGAVINFVNHRTFKFLESKSKYSYSYLSLEIGNYFDIVVDYIT